MGLVSKSSKVPSERSSAKLRMVNAGIKNNKSSGALSKKGAKSPNPADKTLY